MKKLIMVPFFLVSLVFMASINLANASETTGKVLYIISHPSSALTNLSVVDVQRIFLGKLPIINDVSIVPVNLAPDSLEADAFNKQVLKKSATALKEYWISQKLSGGAKESVVVASPDEMLQLSKILKGKFLGYTFGPVNPLYYKVILKINL